MADMYKMDGHKLYWHLGRVNDWMNGKRIAPLHIDVGLSKGCNIKCEYCYGVLQGNSYKKGMKDYFPRDALLDYMRSAGQVGVKSMAFIGEAEPLVNPNVYDAIVEGKKSGIDMALGTNGTMFKKDERGRVALENLTWLRFNLSAASDEAYQRVHGSKLFSKLVENIKFCVKTKRDMDLPVTLGLQMVLTPTNVDQAVSLAELGKQLGVDYCVIKQCSDTVDNALGIYNNLGKYKEFTDILKNAEATATEDYKVIVKWKKIGDEGKRNYDQCLGAPFILYSTGNGKVYPCGMFFDNPKFDKYLLGDLTKQSFKEIIESDHYWDVIEKMKQIDVHKVCYSGCRTHCVNEFLWMLKNSPDHVNFV